MNNKIMYAVILVLVISGAVTIIGFKHYLDQKKEMVHILMQSTQIPLIYELHPGDPIINSGEQIGEIMRIDYSCDRSQAFILANVTLENYGGIYYFQGYDLTELVLRTFMFLHKKGVVTGNIIAINITPTFEEKEIWISIPFEEKNKIPSVFYCDGVQVASVLDTKMTSTYEGKDRLNLKLNITVMNVVNQAYFLDSIYNDSMINLPYNGNITEFFIEPSLH